MLLQQAAKIYVKGHNYRVYIVCKCLNCWTPKQTHTQMCKTVLIITIKLLLVFVNLKHTIVIFMQSQQQLSSVVFCLYLANHAVHVGYLFYLEAFGVVSWLFSLRALTACQSHTLFFVHIILCRQMNGSLLQGPALNEVSRRRPEVLCKQLCGWFLIRVMGVAGVGPSSHSTGLESTLDRLSMC